MKQILKTVYELDEVKEKAIKKNEYINVDYDWYKFILDEWEEKLKSFGFARPEIYFNGFGSQGDGACFDCDSYYIDLDILSQKIDLTEEQQKRLYDLKPEIEIKIEKNQCANHYSHYNTRYINIYHFLNDDEDVELINEAEEKIENLRAELCKEIYNDLEEQYYYLISDEAIYETLQANEYYFNEDGSIA